MPARGVVVERTTRKTAKKESIGKKTLLKRVSKGPTAMTVTRASNARGMVPVETTLSKATLRGIQQDYKTTIMMDPVTLERLRQLMVIRSMKKLPLVRTLVEEVEKSSDLSRQLQSFYEEVWLPGVEPKWLARTASIMRMNWSNEIHALATSRAIKLSGRKNLSRYLRALVAFYAQKELDSGE